MADIEYVTPHLNKLESVQEFLDTLYFDLQQPIPGKPELDAAYERLKVVGRKFFNPETMLGAEAEMKAAEEAYNKAVTDYAFNCKRREQKVRIYQTLIEGVGMLNQLFEMTKKWVASS